MAQRGSNQFASSDTKRVVPPRCHRSLPTASTTAKCEDAEREAVCVMRDQKFAGHVFLKVWEDKQGVQTM